MGFPIDPNIPGANDKPSNSQSDIQTNFDHINSYVQVDHIDPASATIAGMHKQVRFGSNNVPAVFPVPYPNLFSSTTDGAGNAIPGGYAQPFYYSGEEANSKDQTDVTSTSGSMPIFGGLILKWGQAAGVSNNQAFTFAGAFPNAVFALTVGGGVASTTQTKQPIINFNQASLTTSGFNTRIDWQSGTTPTTINYYYIAIGN